MNFRSRLKALEQRRQASNTRFRLVASTSGMPLNLATSTCTRTLGANGVLTEIVDLDGSDTDLSDEDLEEFIDGFPVKASQ